MGASRNKSWRGRADRVDLFMRKLRSYRFFVPVAIVCTAVIYVGSIFGSLSEILTFFKEEDGFSKPTFTISEQQRHLQLIALKIKEEFDYLAIVRKPPAPIADFDHINSLIKEIAELDPDNGHVAYYRGFIKRYQNEKQNGHEYLYRYLEYSGSPDLSPHGDNGEARFCSGWRGYCKYRQAYINHVLALDFWEFAQREENFLIALDWLRSALSAAESAIILYDEFETSAHGIPTKRLAILLREKISELEGQQNYQKVLKTKMGSND